MPGRARCSFDRFRSTSIGIRSENASFRATSTAAGGAQRAPSRFDYSQIPLGYYDDITRRGNPIRRLWHLSKFERVIDCLPRHARRLSRAVPHALWRLPIGNLILAVFTRT